MTFKLREGATERLNIRSINCSNRHRPVLETEGKESYTLSLCQCLTYATYHLPFIIFRMITGTTAKAHTKYLDNY